MADFRKMDFFLFNQITDALEELPRGNDGLAADRLRQAQQQGEDWDPEDEKPLPPAGE